MESNSINGKDHELETGQPSPETAISTQKFNQKSWDFKATIKYSTQTDRIEVDYIKLPFKNRI